MRLQWENTHNLLLKKKKKLHKTLSPSMGLGVTILLQ